MIAKWVNKNQRNWDETLPAVAFAYRTSVNESTGFTPYFLMYGREARIPADLIYGDIESPAATVEGDPVTERLRHLRSAYETTREHLGAAAKRRKRYYDLRAKLSSFPVGCKVWCLNPRPHKGRYRKWQSPYLGPFDVVRQLGPVTYEVRRGPHAKPWTVHVDKLKPYEGVDETASEPVIATPDSGPAPVRPHRDTRKPARFRD